MLLSPLGEPVPRVLTFTAALALGYTPGVIRIELRHGRWQRLGKGVYLTRVDAPNRSDWIQVGMAVAGRGAALSGWDAVRARAIGSERPPVDDVLVIRRGGRHRRCGRVWVRPSDRPMHVTRLPLAEPMRGSADMVSTARAVADTALAYRTFDPVRALVTAAVQRRLCTPEELELELMAGPQNGSAHLRRAIDDVFGGAESISEAAFADLLRDSTLPVPEFNVPIVTAGGQLVATVDALWRDLRAALEIDSREHHFYEHQWRGTMRRHNRMTALGLSMTHYAPVELLTRPAQCVDELHQWLRARAVELGIVYSERAAGSAWPGRPGPARPYVVPSPLINSA